MVPMMLAIAIPNFVKAREVAQRNACVNNLRQIDGAIQQWALEASKPDDAVPTFADIKRYWGNPPFTCPAGGSYTLSAVNERPTCSVPGHELADERQDDRLRE
jgi:type II secretory pathway pseudopilin PulG